jgi:hypothetical protein
MDRGDGGTKNPFLAWRGAPSQLHAAPASGALPPDGRKTQSNAGGARIRVGNVYPLTDATTWRENGRVKIKNFESDAFVFFGATGDLAYEQICSYADYRSVLL